MLCIKNFGFLIKQFKTQPATLSTVLKHDMHTVQLTDNVEMPALGYGTYRVISEKKINLILNKKFNLLAQEQG